MDRPKALTGPFLRTDVTIERVMTDVLLALIPCVLAGTIFFGWRALLVVALALVPAVLCEALLLRRGLSWKALYGDGSAAVTGLILGLILPPSVDWWVPILGSVFAIAIVKLPFGGLGYNIFNPALAARAVLLLGFTAPMVRYVAPFDAVSSATPLLTLRDFDWSLVWGNVPGSIGETSVIAILLGAAFLLYKGHIDWRIPVGYLGTAGIFALLWGIDPLFTITAGGLLFAAAFMATDMVTSPITPMGRLLFGAGCGFLTVFLRQFTVLPEGVTFAVLVMNATVPLLDKLTVPVKFGQGMAREQRIQASIAATLIIALAWGGLALMDSWVPASIPVTTEGVYLPISEQLGSADYSSLKVGETTYYYVGEEQAPERIAFIAQAKGFNGPIILFVVANGSGEILALEVVEHQEDPGLGARITENQFRSQFIGKDRQADWSLGSGIEAISGATISSRAVISGLRSALDDMNQAFYGSEETELAAGWADGVYGGEAESFGGTLTVEVEVVDGAIADVRVVSHADTPGISDQAIEEMPQRIVESNTWDVDTVSGATISSEGIAAAVKNALEGAAVSGQKTELAAGWADGVYGGEAESFGGTLTVEVEVVDGAIADVRVVSHADTPGISDQAIEEMPERIVTNNTWEVETVSGATISSKAIVAAVENALKATPEDSASVESSAAPQLEILVDDGVYRGVGEGFEGEIVVEVTVDGGQITAIEVIEHGDTAFVAESAFRKMIPQIIEEQTLVDTVSNATMSSRGLLNAVSQAVSGQGTAVEAAVEAEDDAAAATWADGVYGGEAESFGGTLTVEVEVVDGAIADVRVVSHADTPGISDQAIEEMPERIVTNNTWEVETVSGATISSKAIAAAVENALKATPEDSASVESSAAPQLEILVGDGVYRGTAEGFESDITVEVTVSDGKITAIEVVEHGDTVFVAESAFRKLIPQIIEEQALVDTVSNATMSSRGLLEAVRRAVSGEGEE